MTDMLDNKEVEKFEQKHEYEGVLGNNFKIKTMIATECGRLVLRVLLPDENGKFPGDSGCKPIFDTQDQIIDF
jgi:hypothetical protein